MKNNSNKIKMGKYCFAAPAIQTQRCKEYSMEWGRVVQGERAGRESSREKRLDVVREEGEIAKSLLKAR